MAARGAAWRRRQRRLRSMLRHERQTVAMALAECQHHSAQRQQTARAGEWVRGALHGEVPEAPTPQEPGTHSVPELGCSRPDRLVDVRPQGRVPRCTVEQIVDTVPVFFYFMLPSRRWWTRWWKCGRSSTSRCLTSSRSSKCPKYPLPVNLAGAVCVSREQLVEVPVPSFRDCVIQQTLSSVVLSRHLDADGCEWCHCSGPRGLYWWLSGTQHAQWTLPEGLTASPGRKINTGQG